jgi:hypothetical protein
MDAPVGPGGQFQCPEEIIFLSFDLGIHIP